MGVSSVVDRGSKVKCHSYELSFSKINKKELLRQQLSLIRSRNKQNKRNSFKLNKTQGGSLI